MEKQFPKNVRQIGNVSDTPKIYVEDYVDTFFNQLCDKALEEPVGAFLIGQAVIQEEQECVYISGAIQIPDIEMIGPDVAIGESVLTSAEEMRKEYFEDGEIIGWFLAMPGQPLGMNSNIRKLHERYFAKENHIFIMRDPVERDEVFFAYKFKELMQMGGHYIYYEKNPSMQNYMITQRKKIGVTPSEMVADRAAKDFRSIINNRMKENHRNQSTKWTYAASTFLVLVVLVIGVTMLNNYDKMQAVQSALDDIKQTVAKGEGDSEPASSEVVQKVQSDPVDVEQEKTDQDQQTRDSKDIDDSVPAEEVGSSTYVVEAGDTLAKISMKIYGDRGHVDEIKKMNDISSDNIIYEGQKLLLP